MLFLFFQPVTYMKPIFFLKNNIFWNETLIFLTNKHGFQENKHYFFLKKNKFSLYFFYCPESLLKVCCKLSVKLSGGVASLTETFNANLQGWIESFNANFQGWIESLKKLAGLH